MFWRARAILAHRTWWLCRVGTGRGQTPTVACRPCVKAAQSAGRHPLPGRRRRGAQVADGPHGGRSNRAMTADDAHRPSTAAVLLAGALALAVAMAIGRFAFTPLLPLMMRDGLLDAAGGAELAAANYLGYLVGALTAGRLAARPLPVVRASLPALALLTAATGWTDHAGAWTALRFAAGVVSAWALVATSSWALTTLAARGRGLWVGGVFSGVGSGVALAGLVAWAAADQPSAALWQGFGALAAVLAAAVAWLLRDAAPPRPPPAVPAASAGTPTAPGAGAGAPADAPFPPGSWPLVVCYGVFGFGYIGPATFLPAMARALIDDPARFGLVWPLFGAAAVASTLGSLRLLARLRPLQAWVLCQSTLALGTAMPLLSRSPAALVVAALAVGSTFVLVTVIAMAVARERVPRQPAPLVARMTAAFALGQIAGPLLVRALDGVHLPGLAGWGPIELSSALASAAVLTSVVWLWRLSAASPAPRG